jgi:predicted extracellular nuclease
MLMKRVVIATTMAAVAVLSASQASAAIRITEWMYNGDDGEFVELTNVGAAPVDLAGWDYSDSARAPGITFLDLSGFGVVQPGESVIFTEASEAGFRNSWASMPALVKVIGANTVNLGRNDEINIYDAANALVDRLTYNDQGAGNVAGPRTSNISGNPLSLAVLGANNASQWVLSSNGDSYGSTFGVNFSVANPGMFSAVPEPATLALAAAGALVIAMGRSRKR